MASRVNKITELLSDRKLLKITPKRGIIWKEIDGAKVDGLLNKLIENPEKLEKLLALIEA